jgi:hypothetical protein
VLCEDTTGRDQVEAALRCAVEASTRYCGVVLSVRRVPYAGLWGSCYSVSMRLKFARITRSQQLLLALVSRDLLKSCFARRMIFPKLSKLHAAQVCAKETSSGPVLACLREVSKGVSASSPSAYLATPESVVAVCSLAAGPSSAGGGGGGSAEGSKARSSGRGYSNAVASNVVRPGACLAKLASISSSKLIFDATVPPHLCAHADPTAVLTCLESLHKRMVSVDDVTACINTKQEVKSMRVKRILTEDNGIEIVAGEPCHQCPHLT